MASSSSQQKIVQHDLLSEREKSAVKSFDVFINHRGPDVKETLAYRLYNSLQDVGCRAFLDSEELELGDSIPAAIRNAICSASVQIAIFSPRYAESSWCLTELDLMLETKAMFIPVFYQVKPSDLRYIESGVGVYAAAFSKYASKGRYLNYLEKWKDVLHSASLSSGYEFSENHEDYSQFQKIVSAVQQEVTRRKPLDVGKHTVGLDELLDHFETIFQQNKDENVKIIGIFGMGGSGKTTLAKAFFNRKRLEYDKWCFVSDVREMSAKGGMPSLQSKILKDLVKGDFSFQSISEGTTHLRNHLRGTARFLIVLDDISDLDQLEALPFADTLLNPGSLVIVTTRDKGLLASAGISVHYEMKKLDRYHARELFCWHALRQPNPAKGYEDLVERLVMTCGGLPLSIKVLGGHVARSDHKDYWQSVLDKFGKVPHEKVKQKLEISFDALDTEEKQIFMDIACFFIGKPKATAIRIWQISGWNAEHALQILQDKCLVEVGYAYGELVLNMHDHLRDMGREMADELTSFRRLWSPQYLKSLGSKGFQNILKETNGRCFHSIFDSSMQSKITYFIGNANNCSEKSTNLLWLELDLKESQMKYIPSWIPLQNLQCLRIIDGRLQRLWQGDLQSSCFSFVGGIRRRLQRLWQGDLLSSCFSFVGGIRKLLCQSNAQGPSELKELLVDTTVLREFPNTLGILNNLENLTIKGKYFQNFNSNFTGWELSDSLKELSNLRSLVLFDLFLSGELTLSSGGDATSFESSMGSCMNCLKTIQIRGVKFTSRISISGEHCPSIESLRIDSMENLIELDLRRVATLNSLMLMYCKNLKRISGNLDLGKLAILNIKECSELTELPSLAQLSCLERITIDQCQKLRNIRGIEELEGLKYLYISTGNGGVDVWNCIQRLKRLPSEFTTAIGRAVDGAESTLNANFFSGLIDAEAVTDFDSNNENSKVMPSVKLAEPISAIIICALVHSSFEGEIKTPVTRWRPIAQGERIVTIAVTGHSRIYQQYSPEFNLGLAHAELKKKCIVIVKKGEEEKALHIFKTIVGHLYQGIP